jgi:3-deoxy-D-manno-octulosonic-acid transferase
MEHSPLARMGIAHRTLWVVYELGWMLFIAGWFLYVVARKGKEGREEIAQRMGYVPLPPSCADSSIWIHAVSVGELLSIRPVIEAMKRQSPGCWILVTTSNEAAYQMAIRKPPGADALSRTPWDTARCIRRALARSQPKTLAIVECEIWPNLIRLTAEQGRMVLMINARIYERDYPRYLAARSLFAPILQSITGVYTQSSADRDRFLAMGVPSHRVMSGGNTKFDAVPSVHVSSESVTLRRSLRLGDCPLLILASTHEDEEQQLLEHVSTLQANCPTLQILIAPRDIHRAERIASLVEKSQLKCLRRSQVKMNGERPDVVILDTLGELVQVLGWGDLVFVGGSLVDKGGHNPIEPAAWGKPVLMGPHFANFTDIVQAFREGEAIGIFPSAESLCIEISRLLSDSSLANEMGSRARQVVEQHRGTSERYATLLLQQSTGRAAA